MPAQELEALTWSRADIDARQEQLLGEVVGYAYERSQLMRGIWDRAGVHPDEISSKDDFVKKAPFVTADEIRDAAGGQRDPFRDALCMPVHELTVVGTTSGTTGLPQALPQHKGDTRSHSAIREYQMNGVGAGSRVLISGQASRSGHGGEKFATLGAMPIFMDGDPSVAEQLVKVAREFRPTHWWVLTGPLLFALQQYEQASGDDLTEAFSSIGPVIFGGEPLSAANRATLDRWGLSTRLMTSLGNTCAAVECSAQDGSHIWEDLVFAECLDVTTGEPVADGERGELIVTSLVDRAAPMLRYRSGDLVELTRKQCACGLRHGRIRTIGRLVDLVEVGGVRVLPVDVWSVVDNIPATAAGVFQIVRSKSNDKNLYVRIGYDRSLAASESALREELELRLHYGIGVGCTVEVLPADDMVSGRGGVKLKRVVD